MTVVLDKDFKIILLTMLKRSKEDTEKVKKMMCEQNGNTSKETENQKKFFQKEILVLRSTISVMKNDSKADVSRKKKEWI